MGIGRTDTVEDLIRWLTTLGLEATRVREGRVMTMLSGEHKRTIHVLFHVDDRHVHVTSLLCGVPDEGHAEVYALLLHRNERATDVHFALDDGGDVILVGREPVATFTEQRLDAILGSVLDLADRTFNEVLRRGFATYLDREQRWRMQAGMAPNPIGSPVMPDEGAPGA